MSDINELLKQCEKELQNANDQLSALMESPEEMDEQELISHTDYLLGQIDILTKRFNSLLQSL